MWHRIRTIAGFSIIIALSNPVPAAAWGNTGHELVGALAARILKSESPATLEKVEDFLENDDDDSVSVHDLANQAKWADVYRDSSPAARALTKEWHYVDIDHDAADLTAAMKAACFGHPKLGAQELASETPPKACVADKIQQFRAEIANTALPEHERLLALKFLLHFVGDIHQPLHAIERRDPVTNRGDSGGNCVGLRKSPSASTAKMHSYWDTTLIGKALPSNREEALTELMKLVTPANVQAWTAKSEAADWALESYAVAKAKVYAPIISQQPIETGHIFQPDNGCGPSKVYLIPADYETNSIPVVKEQLAKAAVRLARLLKDYLK